MTLRRRFTPDSPLALERRAVPATLAPTSLPFGTVDGVALQLSRPDPRFKSAHVTLQVEQITARGSLGTLGKVAVHGTITEGVAAAGIFPYAGRLVVREARGTIALNVSGNRNLSTGAPLLLNYIITGGTGRDRGATGSGQILLADGATPVKGHPSYLPTHLTFYQSSISPLAIDGIARGDATQTVAGGYSRSVVGQGTYAGVGAITSATADVALFLNGQADHFTLEDSTGSVTLTDVGDLIHGTRTFRVTAGTGRYAAASGYVVAEYFIGPIEPANGTTAVADGTYATKFELVFGDGGGQTF